MGTRNEIVYESITPIDKDKKKIIDTALAPLGFRVRGQWRAHQELLLECYDVDIASRIPTKKINDEFG